MAHEDAAEFRMGLQARGQIHFAADDGVVHPVFAAEITDRAITRVDADPQLERLFAAEPSAETASGWVPEFLKEFFRRS
jgi:hypothetical protein